MTGRADAPARRRTMMGEEWKSNKMAENIADLTMLWGLFRYARKPRPSGQVICAECAWFHDTTWVRGNERETRLLCACPQFIRRQGRDPVTGEMCVDMSTHWVRCHDKNRRGKCRMYEPSSGMKSTKSEHAG